MSAFVIILLIVLGLFLLVMEFFVIPGMTLAGIGGLLFTAAGVFLAYKIYGTTVGHITLIGTLLAGLFVLVLSFRSGTWNKLMLKSTIESQVETVEEVSVQPGDLGITITRLNPIGKVRVNNMVMEAKCPGMFVDERTEVEVKEVFKTFIIVKPKK
ncbi:hypothetical protein DMA11_00870 [Marinilabiliaceae bacterium JC017]|nr:hypothetical protein DMA11_00870 [Marinilabiliaceae bacterium JC017]